MGNPTALAGVRKALTSGRAIRVRGAEYIAFTPATVRLLARRIAAGEARMEILSLLATQLVMPKKNSTQVMEFLRDLPLNLETDDVTMSSEKRDWCVSMLSPVDQRHEKKQKKRKKAKRKVAR